MTPKPKTTIAARIRIPILRLPPAPRAVKQSLIILVTAYCLTETPSLLDILIKDWVEQTGNWFLLPGFHLKHDRQLVWMLKACTDDIFVSAWIYVAAKIAKHYSDALFLVFFICWAYSLVDGVMLWIDFKTSHYVYFDLLTTCIILAKGVFKGYKPETIAKVKSLF